MTHLLYFKDVLYIAGKSQINVIEIPDTLKNEEEIKVHVKDFKSGVVEPGILVHAILI